MPHSSRSAGAVIRDAEYAGGYDIPAGAVRLVTADTKTGLSGAKRFRVNRYLRSTHASRPSRSRSDCSIQGSRFSSQPLSAKLWNSNEARWTISGGDPLAKFGNALVPLDRVDLATCGMVLEKNGEIVATGAGAAALGSPLNAVAWLANTLGRFGISLKAGEVASLLFSRMVVPILYFMDKRWEYHHAKIQTDEI